MKQLYRLLTLLILLSAFNIRAWDGTGYEGKLYIIGEFNEWLQEDPTTLMTCTSPGIFEIDLPDLSSGFKFNDGSWLTDINIGSDPFYTTTLTIGKPYALYVSPYESGQFAADIEFEQGVTGIKNAHIVANLNTMSVLITGEPYDALHIYVIGSDVNGQNWVMKQPDAKMTQISSGVFEWYGERLGTGFKFNNGSWTGKYNFGSNGNQLILGKEYKYSNPTDYNIYFQGAEAVLNPHIILNLDKGTVLVEGIPVEEELNNVYLVGSFNDWGIDLEESRMQWTGDKYIKTGVILPESEDTYGFFKIKKGLWIDSWGFGQYSDNDVITSGNLSVRLTRESQSPNSDMAYNISGIYDVVWDPKTEVISFIKTGEEGNPLYNGVGDLYLIGNNINGHTWMLMDETAKFTFIGNGTYVWSGAYLNNGFKINDGTWDNNVVNGLCLNIGSDIYTDTGIIVGQPYKFNASCDSGNLGFVNFSEIINPLVKVNVIDQTLTVTMDGHNLEVFIPQIEDQNYKNCVLELIDNVKGTKNRALLSNRENYTFQGLTSNGDYTLRLLTPTNAVIGLIEHYIMPSEDARIEFANIKDLHTIATSILSPDGTDVTSKAIVEWYTKDEAGSWNYLKQSNFLNDCPTGQNLKCKISLDRELGSLYINPEELEFVVDSQYENIVFKLSKLKHVELGGTVMDETGTPLKGITVSASMILNGKYPKTVTSTTSENGIWNLSIPMANDIVLIYSGADFLDIEQTISEVSNDKLDMGDIKLKRISGFTIEYEIAFNDPFSDEIESPYSDYRNVGISVFNKTQNKKIEKISLKYPHIVIYDETLHVGDKIEVTASSKTGIFNPISTTLDITDGSLTPISFMIHGKGGIKASFEMTENKNAVCMLFDSKDEFIQKQSYKDTKAEFSVLDDGIYHLVSMGQSDYINFFSHLSAFNEIGLQEGKDYVINDCVVKKGEITTVHNTLIPSLDDSKFLFTTTSSEFTVNKSNITTGNFLTLKANIEFKENIKNLVSDCVLLVEMPDSSDFIENSVIQGSKLLSYSKENNTLEIPLTENFSDPIRFCVMPTESGKYTSSAYLSFVYNGEHIKQPIGSVTSSINDIEIIAPSIINTSDITVRGKALPNSNIKILWDDNLAGIVSSNSIGEWEYNMELGVLKPFTMHSLSADIETPAGVKMVSETKSVLYDNDCPKVFGVVMINQAHRYGHIAPEITYFDFVRNNPPKPYWYMPDYPTFTFEAAIKDGEHSKVTSVTIYVLTEVGEWMPMKATYDKNKDLWIASKNFTSGNLPVNVGISFTTHTDGIAIERMARILLDNHLASKNLLSDNDYAFTTEEVDSEIIFHYAKPNDGSRRLQSILMSESGETISKFSEAGKYYSIRTSTNGIPSLPSMAEEYSLGNGYALYISTDSISQGIKNDIIYPVNLIEALLNTVTAAEDDTFDFFRDLLASYPSSKYVCISYLMEGEGIDNRKYCSRCDEAEYNCPELSPIIANLRYREAHASALNENLDRFRNVLDWIGHACDLLSGETAEVVSGATGLASHAIEFGQNAGNYINGLHNRNDYVELEVNGCLPNNGQQYPDYPGLGGGAGNVQDPSGYVYEAVPSNRVEGVQASIYYKDYEENIYGDVTEVVRLWDAEEYSQENPIFTDKNGMYQWDVPKGLWQVKLEKEGYETAYSEWLPVPPPQLDVNIPIVQLSEPEISSVHAFASGIDITFNKYMDISTLTSGNIHIFANGAEIKGDLRFPDIESSDPTKDEKNSQSPQYASRIRFVPESQLSDNLEEVSLTVNRNVRSYAGIPMSAGFKQSIDIEPEVYSIYAEDTKVKYGDTKNLRVSVLPPEAAVGKILNVTNSGEIIASVSSDSFIIDEDGNVELSLKGELPGLCQLYFSIDDVTTTGECTINVLTEILTPENPQASRANYSEVYFGSKVELSTDTQDGVIYYTLDGTCPCDENGTRRKYSAPIIIDKDTHILAMTILDKGLPEYSETVEFNYTVKRNILDLELSQGWTWLSHSSYSPISTSYLFNTGVVKRIHSKAGYLDNETNVSNPGHEGCLYPGEMYKVEATEYNPIRIEEIAFNPSNPILISEGVNWIGYPLSHSTGLNEAFVTAPEYLDLIVGQDGFSQFDGEKWIGTLHEVNPGKGYIYHSSSDKQIVFNNSLPQFRSRKFRETNMSDLMNIDCHKYPEITPIIFRVLCEDNDITTSDLTVIASTDTDQRGIGYISDGLGFISIFGNEDDLVSLSVLDNDGNILGKQDVKLCKDLYLGSIEEPYVISVDNTHTHITQLSVKEGLEVYIDGRILYIMGDYLTDNITISLYDPKGVCIHSEETPQNNQISLDYLANGIYIIHIITDKQELTAKLILN